MKSDLAVGNPLHTSGSDVMMQGVEHELLVNAPLHETSRPHRRYCDQRCRKRAWLARWEAETGMTYETVKYWEQQARGKR